MASDTSDTAPWLLVRGQKPAGSSSTDEFIKLVRDPFNSALETTAFWSSLATSILLTIVLALFFSILRPHHAAVYAPRLKRANHGHVPPPVGKGFFSWIPPVLKTDEGRLIDAVGLDATIFLRFTRMCRDLFLAMALVGCAILIPANLAGANKTLMQGQNKFTLMSPIMVYGKPLWAQVISAWLFNLLVAGFLWYHYRAVRRLRRNYFESSEYQARLHSRTLLITDIPKPYRTDEGVLRLSEEIKSTAAMPRSVIGREVKGLSELHRRHEMTVRQLESHLAKYLKNPRRLPARRPTCTTAKGDDAYGKQEVVDAIDYLTDRMQRLETKIKRAQDNIDMRRAMPYGFSSYDTAREAHTVAYRARRRNVKGAHIRLAPTPDDIIWDNLPLTKSARRWKKVGNTAWVALLTVIWIVPNALIAIFLANLSNLGRVWPAFKTSLEGNRKVWAAVQGIASPAILSLFYLVLPTIFRRLSVRAGDKTKTSRERHVIHQLYAFFIFNNLIVFTGFSTVFRFVSTVITLSKDHTDFWSVIRESHLGDHLLAALCAVSPFWVTWLLQRNLGAAVDLSQLWNLFVIWFAKTFMSPTPRQREEWMRPPPFDYASYYNYFLFYATVALCFATLQPIVLPVTALYFIVDNWLKKYLLMYVFYTKTESGGQFWRVVFNRMVFATILANIVVALVVYARKQYTMTYAMIPPPILMLAFKFYCRKTFDDDMHYYRRSLNHSETLPLPTRRAIRNENLAGRFENPAFYKPLMAPMVLEEARAVLVQIYHGRLHSDSADLMSTNRDGIRLDSMSEVRAGKIQGGGGHAGHTTAADSKMPFRFVPESLLSDDTLSLKGGYPSSTTTGSINDGVGGLRSEYGIDDIEGRPIDLISERPDTPGSSSYRGHDPTIHSSTTTPPFSRTASPAFGLRQASGGSGRVGGGEGSVNPFYHGSYFPPQSYHRYPLQSSSQQQQQQQQQQRPLDPTYMSRTGSAASHDRYVPSTYTDVSDGVSGQGGHRVRPAGGEGGLYAHGNDSQVRLLSNVPPTISDDGNNLPASTLTPIHTLTPPPPPPPSSNHIPYPKDHPYRYQR